MIAGSLGLYAAKFENVSQPRRLTIEATIQL